MNTITKEQIDALIAASTLIDFRHKKTTILHCTLPSGFELVASSACVDIANYSHEIGIKICKERIVNQLWQLEGYRLQCELSKAGA